MKFCYFDESGMGTEPYLVTVGIIADSTRMHITKDAWEKFLLRLSFVVGQTVKEFHSRDFYRGNKMWRGIDGDKRSKVIDAVISWAADRKHKCVFSGIDRGAYNRAFQHSKQLKSLESQWCTAAMHCILQIQKEHQKQDKTKGHSVLVFDHEVKWEVRLSHLVYSPPAWTDTYYSRDAKKLRLDQIVDVPYFADSTHLQLVQVADLFAYILRTSAEITDGLREEQYPGEGKRMQAWCDAIARISLPRASRYPKTGRCTASQVFWDLAPETLRSFGK